MRVLALVVFSVTTVTAVSAQCWSLSSGTVVCNPVKANLTSGCVELLSGTVVC